MRAPVALVGVFFATVFLLQGVTAAAVQMDAADYGKRSWVTGPAHGPGPSEAMKKVGNMGGVFGSGILGKIFNTKKKPARRAVKAASEVLDVEEVMSELTAGLGKRGGDPNLTLLDMLYIHTIGRTGPGGLLGNLTVETTDVNKTEKRDAPADEQARENPPSPPGGVNQADWDDCMKTIAANPINVQGPSGQNNIRITGFAPACKSILLDIEGAEYESVKPTDCGVDCVEYTNMSQEYYEEIRRLVDTANQGEGR